MDTSGQVTDAPPAEKPTGGMQQFPTPAPILGRFASAPLTCLDTTEKDVDEVTEMFKGLSKKKKTSKKSKTTEGGDDEEAPAADGEFDPSALKKKKKKTSKTKADPNDFEAKLAEAGVAEEPTEDQPEELPEGDLEAGTGIWAHDATQPIPYSLLVKRFFSLIESHHPDLLSSGAKSYKIPPPQCLREGNRRTIFANIADICKRMKRRFVINPPSQPISSILTPRSNLARSTALNSCSPNWVHQAVSTAVVAWSSRADSNRRVSSPFCVAILSSTSHARPAAAPIPSSTRERTVSTSLLATPVVLVVPSPPSRPVSVPRSAAESVWAKWMELCLQFAEGLVLMSSLWRVTY